MYSLNEQSRCLDRDPEVQDLMEEYIAGFEPGLCEPGNCLFEDDKEAPEAGDEVGFDYLWTFIPEMFKFKPANWQ